MIFNIDRDKTFAQYEPADWDLLLECCWETCLTELKRGGKVPETLLACRDRYGRSDPQTMDNSEFHGRLPRTVQLDLLGEALHGFGAVGYVVMSEAWMVGFETGDPDGNIKERHHTWGSFAQHPRRVETLVATLATRTGYRASRLGALHRLGGAIEAGPVIGVELEVWKAAGMPPGAEQVQEGELFGLLERRIPQRIRDALDRLKTVEKKGGL